ncbi:MAG: methylated-DNA--[protein]-cysteine S-methyltransferase [Fibrobacteria bacterium]
MKCYRKTIATPVGEIILAASEQAVMALLWNREDLPRLGLEFAPAGGTCDMLQRAEIQLGEYFRGSRKRFDLPLELRGTAFQRKVWAELEKIPFGATWSYRELAERIGNPGAVRAVGTANGRNPVCILIPCHRVVRVSGDLGGYAGGLENKAFLLELEKELDTVTGKGP